MTIFDSHLQAREDEQCRRALFTANNPPHLLSHFAVSFTSIDSTVDPGIESRSAILWLCYLIPLPPPFAASDEIHRFCFRRWVRFRCRCLYTPCWGSTRRGVSSNRQRMVVVWRFTLAHGFRAKEGVSYLPSVYTPRTIQTLAIS